MTTPTAKDLLAQADRLMKQRTPEELPVLTDLVIEEIELTSLTDRMDDVIPTHASPAWASVQARPALAAAAPNPYLAAPPRVSAADVAPPVMAPSMYAHDTAPPAQEMATLAAVNVVDALGVLPRMTPEAPLNSFAGAHAATATSATATTGVNARDQFNAQLLTKLEEMQHGVYSQVMQQLEIYASGALKAHLRDTLLPALTDIARDIATQVAEDTSNQVREVVSKAVDSEIARLREQLAAKRRS
jgi:hypothetical protein